MAPRTRTAHLPSVTLPSGGTLTFPVPASPTSRTSLSFPSGSSFDSELHWHESHTEYFRVTQGVVRVVLEDSINRLETFYIGKDSGVVEIPRFRRHRLRRGDSGGKWEEWMQDVEFREGGKIPREVWEVEIRGEEWTSPADGQKEAFFRNLSGVVSEPRRAEGVAGKWREEIWVTLGVFVIMGEFDNFPAFLRGRWRGVERWLSHFVLWVTGVLGRVLGVRGEWEEYTPVELRSQGVVEGGRRDL